MVSFKFFFAFGVGLLPFPVCVLWHVMVKQHSLLIYKLVMSVSQCLPGVCTFVVNATAVDLA